MSPTDRAHFGQYWPPDFGWGGAQDPEAHADQLVPYSHSGVSFGQMHRDAVKIFTALLDELVPQIEGGLRPGKCWCFSTTDNLEDGTRSFHSFGIAIDVNWNVNKMGKNIPDGQGKYAIPRDVATDLAPKYGLEWGGNWLGGFHDNMHFECHLSPADARDFIPEFTMTQADEVKIRQMIDARADATDELVHKLLHEVSGMATGHDGGPHRIETLAAMAHGKTAAQARAQLAGMPDASKAQP
jgi:hypothetical protein